MLIGGPWGAEGGGSAGADGGADGGGLLLPSGADAASSKASSPSCGPQEDLHHQRARARL